MKKPMIFETEEMFIVRPTPYAKERETEMQSEKLYREGMVIENAQTGKIESESKGKK